jgi:hypothetical protein
MIIYNKERQEMEENQTEKAPLIDDETAQKLGDASLQRINRISHMAKEYFRALNGTINSIEMYQLGIDTVVAGLQLVSRSADMDELDVEARIKSMNATLNIIVNLVNKIYLNPDVVAGQVAKAAMESAQRQGIKFNGRQKTV